MRSPSCFARLARIAFRFPTCVDGALLLKKRCEIYRSKEKWVLFDNSSHKTLDNNTPIPSGPVGEAGIILKCGHSKFEVEEPFGNWLTHSGPRPVRTFGWRSLEQPSAPQGVRETELLDRELHISLTLLRHSGKRTYHVILTNQLVS